MVILQQTPTELIFRHRPYRLWIGILGMIFGVPILMVFASFFASWVLYFWWLPLLYLMLFFGSIILGVIAGKTRIYEFNKRRDRLTILSKGILGTHRQEYSLAEIWHIQLEPTNWSPQTSHSYRTKSQNYQIMLILKNGQSLRLNLGIKSTSEAQEQTINQIHQFLGIRLGTWQKSFKNLQ